VLTPDQSPYCRTCKHALNVFYRNGVTRYLHNAESRGGTVDHPADPIPLAELPDAIQLCDLCDGPAAFVYTCDDRITDRKKVTAQYVRHHEYREQNYAARVVRADTETTSSYVWGQRFAICTPCGLLIEGDQLPQLVTRLTDLMPTRAKRGRKLTELRARLYTDAGHLMTTRLPGRHRLTASNPVGVWEPSPGNSSADPS
jgi:hypothetical protein